MTSWDDIKSSQDYLSLEPDDRASVRLAWVSDNLVTHPDFQALNDEDKMDVLNAWEYENGERPEEQQRTFGGTVKDVGVALGKGLVGVTESAMGLAGMASKGLEKILPIPEERLTPRPDAFTTQDASQELHGLYSPAQQVAESKIAEAEGFIPTIKAMAENPSTIATTTLETAPQMLAGGGIGRGLVGLGTKPLLAAAAGEGILSAGSQSEQSRLSSDDKKLTGKQAGMAAASGAITGLISVIGGRIAQKMGFADIDTMLAKTGATETRQGIVKRIIGGGVTEGVIEELPQSVQEQIFQNAATGKPIWEGVGKAGAQGMVAGGMMGAGANVLAKGGGKAKQPDISREQLLNALVSGKISPEQAQVVKDKYPGLSEVVDGALKDFQEGRPNAPDIKTEQVDEFEKRKREFVEPTKLARERNQEIMDAVDLDLLAEAEQSVERQKAEKEEGAIAEEAAIADRTTAKRRFNALSQIWDELSDQEQEKAIDLILPRQEAPEIAQERQQKAEAQTFDREKGAKEQAKRASDAETILRGLERRGIKIGKEERARLEQEAGMQKPEKPDYSKMEKVGAWESGPAPKDLLGDGRDTVGTVESVPEVRSSKEKDEEKKPPPHPPPIEPGTPKDDDSSDKETIKGTAVGNVVATEEGKIAEQEPTVDKSLQRGPVDKLPEINDIEVSKPYTRRQKRQNGTEIETTTDVQLPFSFTTKQGNPVDYDHSRVTVSARGDFKTGRAPKKADSIWGIYNGKTGEWLSTGKKYNDAIEIAKKYVLENGIEKQNVPPIQQSTQELTATPRPPKEASASSWRSSSPSISDNRVEVSAVKRGDKPAFYGENVDQSILDTAKAEGLNIEEGGRGNDWIITPNTEAGKQTASELKALIEDSKNNPELLKDKDWHYKFSKLLGYDEELAKSIRSKTHPAALEKKRMDKLYAKDALSLGEQSKKRSIRQEAVDFKPQWESLQKKAQFKNKDGSEYVFIHKSSRKNVNYQASVFDNAGPVRHYEGKSVEELEDRLRDERYIPSDYGKIVITGGLGNPSENYGGFGWKPAGPMLTKVWYGPKEHSQWMLQRLESGGYNAEYSDISAVDRIKTEQKPINDLGKSGRRKIERLPIVDDNMDLSELGSMDRVAEIRKRFPDIGASEQLKLSRRIKEKKIGSQGADIKGEKVGVPKVWADYQKRETKLKLKKLKDTLKNEKGSSQLYNDIINHGIQLRDKGIDTYEKFKLKMFQKFRTVWNKIKGHMRDLWNILNNERGEITAYHGSPHRLEKFSTEKIGTGEGAQSFGWGLYFTSEKKIAEHYSKISPDTGVATPRRFFKGVEYYEGSPEYRAAGLLEGETLPMVRKEVRGWIENAKPGEDVESYKKVLGVLERADSKKDFKTKYGNIYKATLHEGKDPSEYTWLDWDKRVGGEFADSILSKVEDVIPENTGSYKELVRVHGKDVAERYKKTIKNRYIDAIKKLTELSQDPHLRGHELYRDLTKVLGSQKEASLFLQRAGIDGIRYPAGTLSGGGKGTNYVVFDENAVTIKEINGQLLDALKNEKGSSQLVTDISSFGAEQIRKGVKNFNEFRSAMKERFADIWDKIKVHMRSLWDALNNQRGEINLGKSKKQRADDIIALLNKQSPTKTGDESKSKRNVAQTPIGPVQYSDTIGPVTDQDYIENRKQRGNIKLQAATGFRRIRSEIAQGTDKFLGAISTRLGNINPKLKAKLRKLDFDINTSMAKDIKLVQPLLKKAKDSMTSDDFADWDYARKNSDINKINDLIEKYGLRKEYDTYRKVLYLIREDAIDVGLSVGEIEEYAPRVLKDSRGFLAAIGKEEEWPIYSRRLKERANEMGISVAEMTDDEKANIISNMILFGQSGLGGLRATKQRKIQKIPPSLNRFYMDSDAALVDHIYRMRKGIEARRFFGKIPKKVSEIRRQLNTARSKLREINKLLKTASESDAVSLEEKRNKYFGQTQEYWAYLEKYAMQRDYTENIGQYVLDLIESGEIKASDERVVNDILNARFHEKGTHGLINAYKNMSYIDTMGSPISALTQIGDLAWAAYDGGIIRTLRQVSKSLRGKSRITKEDVGVDRIAQEFADSSTLSKAVSSVFKMVGLEKIDSIGKETLINSAYDKYKKQAKDNPEKLKSEISPIFEEETDSVIDDLQNDKVTDNVKLLVYNRLLDFQPVALSEMPEKYLNAGNGRIFYMLKTFTLKQFDAFRNEAYNKIKNGNKAEKIKGLQNLVKLSMFFVLANAGADELKDFVLGRETEWQDRLVDNALRLFGISKFITWQARTEGVGTAVAKQILPPFKFINSVTKDIVTAGDEKGLETISSIPVAGKLYYWHMGRGSSKRTDLWELRYRRVKSKLENIRTKYEESSEKGKFALKNSRYLSQHRKMKKVQSNLNRLKRRINILKKRNKTELVEKLESRRTQIMKNFVSSYKTGKGK